MQLDYQVKRQIVNTIDFFDKLEGISIHRETDWKGLLAVKGHPPLSVVEYRYICENRLITKDYLLQLICQTKTNLPDCKIYYAYKQKRIQFACNEVNTDISLLLSLLQNNSHLNKRLNTVDFRRLEIICEHGVSYIEIEPFFGSVIQFLLPRAVYHIKPSNQECVNMLQIIQLILSCLKMGP